MNKRGVFFLLDSLIGVSIIIVSIVLVFQFSQEPQEDLNSELQIAESFMNSLSSTQLQDMNDPYVNKLLQDNISQPEQTAMIAVADLYRREAAGELSFGYSQNLTKALTKLIIQDSQYGFYYKLNNTFIINKSMETMQDASKRVTLERMTFFGFNESGVQKMFGPVNTEVSLWVK